MPASPRTPSLIPATATGRALLEAAITNNGLNKNTIRVGILAIEAEAAQQASHRPQGTPMSAPLDAFTVRFEGASVHRGNEEYLLERLRANFNAWGGPDAFARRALTFSGNIEWSVSKDGPDLIAYARLAPAQARPADAALPNEGENMDLLEAAWGIIANANGGNWETANAEWRDAAIRWREAYFAALAQRPTAAEGEG